MQMEHFFSPIQVRTKKKKKGLQQESNTFLPQIYAQMYTHSNYWGGADVDHSQTIGGGCQIIGGYIPPSPRVSASLSTEIYIQRNN